MLRNASHHPDPDPGNKNNTAKVYQETVVVDRKQAQACNCVMIAFGAVEIWESNNMRMVFHAITD